jgi:hypothetical protein
MIHIAKISGKNKINLFLQIIPTLKMSVVGPPGQYAANLERAISYANTMRSAFNWNNIADQFNVTPGVDRPDVDAFIRERAVKAYHNNDFTAEIEEDDYTKAHYNMAQEMIQYLRTGERSWVIDNMDEESINNRVYSLDDAFVTGRPTTGTVIENPYIRQEKYIAEADARVRHVTPNIVPSVPYNELSAPGYTLREFDPRRWKEFERDAMQKWNNKLVKRDGSAQDTYDVGAPAMLQFSTGSRGEVDNLGTPGKVIDAKEFAKTNPMFGSSNPIAESGIKFNDVGFNTVSELMLWPGGQGDFVYTLPDDSALDNVPIRAMALLRVLNGADMADYINIAPSDLMVLDNKIKDLVNRFYQSKPDLLMDQDFTEAMNIFSKQVRMDPAFANLDPVNSMATNDQQQNILTQMNIAPVTMRAASFDHTVDMSVQQEVALQRYGDPYLVNRDRPFSFAGHFDEETEFANIRAILFSDRRRNDEVEALSDKPDVHALAQTQRIMHFNGLPQGIETSVKSDVVESLNGGRGRILPATRGAINRVYRR